MANRRFIVYTIDLLSIPEYVIKKGRLHGHRYGKKLGDGILYGQPVEEEVQEEVLPIRDETLLNRMIENGRNEDVCR